MKSSVCASALGAPLRLWAPERVAGLYAEVYGQVIQRSAQKGTSTFPLR